MKRVTAHLCEDGSLHRTIGEARKQDRLIAYQNKVEGKHALTVESMKWMSEQDAFIANRCYVCVKQFDGIHHFYAPVYSSGGDLLEVQGSVGAIEYFLTDPNFFDLADDQGIIELFLVPKVGQIIGRVTEQGGLNYVETSKD